MKASKRDLTHARMLDAAGQNFRRHGFAGVGVDALAKGAGVTSGAFYSHFGSKDGAFLEAVDKGLEEVVEGLTRFQAENGAGWLVAFVDYYLGHEHQKDLACGCAMASLSSEVMRGAQDQKDLFAAKMNRIIETGANGLSGGTEAERRLRFWMVLSTLVGGLTFARAMQGAQSAEEVISAARSAALSQAGETRAV